VAHPDKNPSFYPELDLEITSFLSKQLYLGKAPPLHFAPFCASGSSF